MSTDTRLSDSDLESLLGQIADEFTDRVNRGEQPDVETYVAAHPELGDVLRQVLTQLLGMRGPSSRGRSRPRSGGSPVSASATVPRRLGDYLLLRLVGRGGMGLVYEAVQESLDRRVALKVLPLAGEHAAGELRRFQHEAQAAARLHHTHIVTVYGAREHDGWHYIDM